ncbi:hypothetical protein CCP3SC1AL1_3610001 [Gammaproteobacteria bacterium]
MLMTVAKPNATPDTESDRQLPQQQSTNPNAKTGRRVAHKTPPDFGKPDSGKAPQKL